MNKRGGVRQGAGRKKLLESDKIQKKQVSLELTIVEFEKLTETEYEAIQRLVNYSK